MSVKEESWLMQLGHTVYEYTVEPYPLMNETLDQLQQAGHRLFTLHRWRCIDSNEEGQGPELRHLFS